MRTSPVTVLAAVLLAACTCGRAAEAPASSSLDRSPAPLPEGWRYELAISGDDALRELRAVLPEGPARVLVPERISELVNRTIPLPSVVRERVDADSPLRCVMLRAAEDTTRMACAMRVAALPPEVVRTADAPRGAEWIDTGERSAAAIAADVLVAAEDRETLERALPWLAFTAMPEEVSRGARVRFAEDVAASAMRPIASAMIASYAREARAWSGGEEASAHLERDAAIALLERELTERATSLGDLGAIELRIDAGDERLSIAARGEVREGTALARELAALPEASVRGIGALPRSTALAWSSLAPVEAREQLAPQVVEVLGPIAGERLRERDRAALSAAASAWGSARGDSRVIAIGIDDGAPWAALASRPAHGVALVPLRDLLATPWASALLAPQVGCAALAPSIAQDGSEIALCPGARVAHASVGDALALVIERGTSHAMSLAQRLATERDELFATTEVARVIAPWPDDAVLAAYASPSALRALSRAMLQGRDAAPPVRAAPIVLTVSREGARAITIEARASRSALEDVAALVESFVGG